MLPRPCLALCRPKSVRARGRSGHRPPRPPASLPPLSAATGVRIAPCAPAARRAARPDAPDGRQLATVPEWCFAGARARFATVGGRARKAVTVPRYSPRTCPVCRNSRSRKKLPRLNEGGANESRLPHEASLRAHRPIAASFKRADGLHAQDHWDFTCTRQRARWQDPQSAKRGAIGRRCRAASEVRGRTKRAAACRFACPALVFDGIPKRAGHGQL